MKKWQPEDYARASIIALALLGLLSLFTIIHHALTVPHSKPEATTMPNYYMAVTPDELELPLAVADTAQELALLRGTTAQNIYAAISKNQPGTVLGERYIKVEEPDITITYAAPPEKPATVTAPPLASLYYTPKK